MGPTLDIHAAARLGMFDRLKGLVEADAGLVHARGGDGQTPLHFAASIEIAEYLLDHGAQIDARDIDNKSRLPSTWRQSGQSARRRSISDLSRRADRYSYGRVGRRFELVRQHLDEDPDSVRISASEKDFPKQNPDSGGSIYIFGFGWTRTAHMLARQFGHEEVFKLLMQRSGMGLRFAVACEVGDGRTLAKSLLAKQPDLIAKQPPGPFAALLARRFATMRAQ